VAAGALESKMESSRRARREKSLCVNGLLQGSIPPAPAKQIIENNIYFAALLFPISSFPKFVLRPCICGALTGMSPKDAELMERLPVEMQCAQAELALD
jgi:hypothetical protein